MSRAGSLVRGAIAGALVAIACAAPQAMAQTMFATQVRAGPGGMVGSDISEGDLTRYAALLGMDEGQMAAATALREVYEQQMREARREIDARMEDARIEAEDSGDFSVLMKEMGKVVRKAAEEASRREAAFFNDIRSLLKEDQAERWPKLERMRRREQMLRFGMVSGEGVDLVRIVGALDLADQARQAISELIEAYEIDMDRVLMERMKQSERYQDAMSNEDGDFSFDMDRMQEMMKESREAGIKVRDINKRHARALEAGLPEEARADFSARVERASFPQVYRASYTARALKAAAEFDDLTGEQRTLLEDMTMRYEQEVERAQSRWAREIESAEEQGIFGGMQGMGMRMVFGGPEEPESLGEARSAKRDIDKRALESLKDLLTEQQVDRLPDRSEDREQHFGGPGMRMRIVE